MEPAAAAQSADSVAQLIAGGGLAIGGALVAKLLDTAGRWVAARNQRTEITPQPLKVKGAAVYASKDDNDRDHENIFSRLITLEKDTSDVKANIGAIKTDVAESKKQIDRLVWNLVPGAKNGG